MLLRSSCLILVATATCAARAQAISAPAAPEPNGIVTGRVFCGDTGRPARFASVSLMPVPEPKKKLPPGMTEPPAKPVPGTRTSLAIDTGLDGSYALTHIAPGTYYVVVRASGYISPMTMFSKKQIDDPTDVIRALINEAVPQVHVEQDGSAHADIQLQRGAAVSGTITYDDGTPASGVSVKVLHKDENGKWVPLNNIDHQVDSAYTSDRGFYRLSALLPDTYMLDTTINLSTEKTSATTDPAGHTSEFVMRSYKSNLSFYGDGIPIMDQATSFTLRGDDERANQDMTLPISKLHKLTGRVAAGTSGHFANAASVDLLLPADKNFTAHANIDREDGLFHFDFVPEGDYTLRITNARDIAWDPAPPGGNMGPFSPPDKERTLATYGNVEMPLILRGDMLDVIATIPAKQNQPAATAASNGTP